MKKKKIDYRTEVVRIFPFLSWGKTMTKQSILSDATAGVVVAFVLIPQAIAYAQLAGLPPQQGLYAALVAPMIAALFGSSTKLSTGPVAIISLITASMLSALNITDVTMMGKYVVILAALVGVMQLALGLARLGFIVNFISHPVMTGFSNAAALIIATSQLPKLFGVKIGNFDHHYETMYHFLVALPSSFHFVSIIFALTAILVIAILKKIHPLTPGVLITMVLSIFFAWLVGFEATGGSVVGVIPPGIPQLSLIQIDFAAVPVLLSTAAIISILGFMESMSIARSLAIKSGEKIDSNQEFIGQGLANILTASVQGYPVSGSFSRSAVNFKAGGQTGLSSVFTSICVLITLVFFTPMLYHLPQSVLAAIIVMSVIGLVRLDKLKQTYQILRSDGLIAILTFLSTLFFAPHLDKGILIGIALSAVYYIYTRTRPHVALLTVGSEGNIVEARDSDNKLCKYISIVRFDGSLFFANANFLENKIMNILSQNGKHIKYIILDAQGINYIDSSGIEMLKSLIEELRDVKKDLFIVRIKEEILDIIKRTELHELVEKRVYHTRTEAIKDLYHKAHKSEEPDCPLISIS
jgi:sulfate permease, SulP family